MIAMVNKLFILNLEWCQIFILDTLVNYIPNNGKEAE